MALRVFVMLAVCFLLQEHNTVIGQTLGNEADQKTFNRHLKSFAVGIFFKASWSQAGNYCRHRGMSLASIHTEEEAEMVKLALDKAAFPFDAIDHDLDVFWTGARKNSDASSFVWDATGAPMTYTKWAPGEPDKAGKCITVGTHKRFDQWYSRNCNNEYYFICEYFPSNYTGCSELPFYL